MISLNNNYLTFWILPSILIWMVIKGYFESLPLLQSLGLLLFIVQFVSLFNSIGHIIPIRYMFGTLMGLQMVVGPLIAYSGNDENVIEVYRMKIDASEYFKFAFPAYLACLIGINMFKKNDEGERLSLGVLKKYFFNNTKIAYVLIGVGFFSSFLQDFAPGELGFYLYLFAGFKFIGVYLLIVGEKKLRPIPLVLVYSSVIGSSLGSGMFHDLLTWLIFLGSVLFIRYKPSIFMKIGAVAIFTVLGILIQVSKGAYRSAEYGWGLEGFSNTIASLNANGGVFNEELLQQNAVRINQGFILSHVMENVPKYVPYSNGETMVQIFLSALLPRFVYKDKLNAGDQEIFMKYTGMMLNQNTSMGLGSMADAYVNFGSNGAVAFMFLFGLMLSLVLKGIAYYSKTYPILLLFTPLLFLYAIRPDCETQTLLGHLFKSIILLFVLFTVFKPYFKYQETQ